MLHYAASMRRQQPRGSASASKPSSGFSGTILTGTSANGSYNTSRSVATRENGRIDRENVGVLAMEEAGANADRMHPNRQTERGATEQLPV